MADTPEEIRKVALETSIILEDTLRSLAGNIGKIFKDALEGSADVSKTLVQDTQRGLNSLARVSTVLANNAEKAAKGMLTQGDVAKQLSERSAKRLALESQINIVGINNTAIKSKLQSQLDEIIRSEIEVEEALKKQLEFSDKINKKVGVLGNTLKGVSKIPILGNFIEAENALIAAQTEAGKVGSTTTSTMLAGLSSIGKSLKKNLTDPTVIWAATFTMIIKQIGKIDSEIVSFQKSLNLSRGEAAELRKELSLAAVQSNTNFLTTTDLAKAQNNYNNLLGIQGKINTKNLEIQARLVELVGIQGENAAKIQFFSEATGKSFETNYKSSLRTTHELSKQFGVQINSKKVLDDVGKSSSYNLAQFRGSTVALTEAVAKAQALGTTLENINKISQSLLQFQSSIEAELEAELLIGKQINLEQARYYALTNQVSKLTDEITKNIGNFSEFSKLNVIQQEAYAKSLGMSVGEMSDMLLKQEYIGKNGEIIKNATDAELQNRIEQLSIQDKFNKSMEKLQDIIGSIVQGPLGTFVGFMGKILESTIGLSAVLGTIVGVQMLKFIGQIPKIIAGFKALKIQALGTAIANMISSAFKSTSWLGPAAFIAASALIGGGIGYIMSQSRKAEVAGDMLSPAKGKTMVSTKEGGLFELSPNDDVIAAPGIINKMGKDKNSSTIISSPPMNIEPLLEKLEQMNNILKAILNKEGEVSIDGNKLGKTLALATYRTGI